MTAASPRRPPRSSRIRSTPLCPRSARAANSAMAAPRSAGSSGVSLARRASSGGAATASRQPRRPHQQERPRGATTRCPASPAPPEDPRKRRPSTTTPEPTPAYPLITTRCRAPESGVSARSSASAVRLASLSSRIGRSVPVASRSASTRGTCRHPRFGAKATSPDPVTTTPATAMPTAAGRTPAPSATASAAPTSRARQSVTASTSPGAAPCPTELRCNSRPDRSTEMVTTACASTWAATTATEEPSNASMRRGRPAIPATWRVPASRAIPASISAVVRLVTAPAARPVRAAISVRDNSPWSRSSRATSARLCRRIAATSCGTEARGLDTVTG